MIHVIRQIERRLGHRPGEGRIAARALLLSALLLLLGAGVLFSSRASAEDFDPAREAQRVLDTIDTGDFAAVHARFDAAMADTIKDRTWHESQEITPRPDGSFDLSLNVALSRELKAWIRSFVPRVVVIKPPSLKDDIERDLKEALSRWKNS